MLVAHVVSHRCRANTSPHWSWHQKSCSFLPRRRPLFVRWGWDWRYGRLQRKSTLCQSTFCFGVVSKQTLGTGAVWGRDLRWSSWSARIRRNAHRMKVTPSPLKMNRGDQRTDNRTCNVRRVPLPSFTGWDFGKDTQHTRTGNNSVSLLSVPVTLFQPKKSLSTWYIL